MTDLKMNPDMIAKKIFDYVTNLLNQIDVLKSKNESLIKDRDEWKEQSERLYKELEWIKSRK